MNKPPLRSPCIALCKLDYNDICQGCYRSITEIVGWKDTPEHQKKIIIERVTRQRQQLKKSKLT